MVKRGNVRRVPLGSVRIVGGAWRGRRVPVAPGTAVRPTPDRVRETLFNWLRPFIEGARCLDLYAGTGVLGFEALSRGAAEAWFVERDAEACSALATQANAFGARPRIARQDAMAFLRAAPSQTFDLVFLDPPYSVSLDSPLASLPPWLARGALIYVERPTAAGLPEIAAAEWHRRGRAGAVEYGLLRLAPASE